MLGGETATTTLAGPLCTSLDRVGHGDLPVDLQPGDVVVFGRAGAYAYTQAMTHFLSHPSPEQVWVGQPCSSGSRSPSGHGSEGNRP